MLGGQTVFGVEFVLGTGLGKDVFHGNAFDRDPHIVFHQHPQHRIPEASYDVVVLRGDHGAVFLGLLDNQRAVDGFERGNVDQSRMDIG